MSTTTTTSASQELRDTLTAYNQIADMRREALDEMRKIVGHGTKVYGFQLPAHKEVLKLRKELPGLIERALVETGVLSATEAHALQCHLFIEGY